MPRTSLRKDDRGSVARKGDTDKLKRGRVEDVLPWGLWMPKEPKWVSKSLLKFYAMQNVFYMYRREIVCEKGLSFQHIQTKRVYDTPKWTRTTRP